MIDDGLIDELAGEYVLGTLSGSALARFEKRLATDPEAARAVAQWQIRLAPLADDVGANDDGDIAPPASVWAAIEARISEPVVSDPSFTLRAGEGDWRQFAPGVAVRTLYVDPVSRMQSFLLRMDPGTRFPLHVHAADEECYMISGDVTFGDVRLKTGDYHLAHKGTTHDPAFSETGCLLFVRGAA